MLNKHNPDSNTNSNITPWIHWNETCLLCLLYIRLNTSPFALAFLSIYSLNLAFYYFTAGIQSHSQHDLYSPRPSPLCFKRFLHRLQRRTASRLLSHFRITMRERWSTILLFFRIWGRIEFSFLRRYFTSKRVMPSSILIEYGAHPHWRAKRLSWKGGDFGMLLGTSRGLIIPFIVAESKIISLGRWKWRTGSGHRRRSADLRYLKSLFVL